MALISCDPDPIDQPTDGFQFIPGTSYYISIGGDVHDTTYADDYPNREIIFEDGRSKMRGTLQIISLEENDDYFGYIFWDDRIYSGFRETRTLTNGVWDTTYTTINPKVESLGDSSIWVEGRLTNTEFRIGRDTLTVLYDRKKLEFDLLTESPNGFKSWAGYPEVRTRFSGSTDSGNLFYYRQTWQLDTLRVKPL